MTTDLWWDRVERIEDVGVRPTFDLEVFPSACFVANDILVHNSYALLEPEIVRHALQRPGEETLLTSLRRVHVVDRMERAIDYFETVPLFRMYLKRILRSPYYMIELKHDHSIYGVSVGDDPEARMAQGKHASRIIVEEAHQYPERAYAKLQGATDPRGSLRLMVGVPDGRVDTPFRKAASRYESFAGRRFRISRRLDPFFSQRDKRDFADTFGGVDHDLFKQEVDALDGSPVWSAWDLDALYRCVEGSLSPLASGKYHLEVSGRVYQDQQLTPQVVCADLPGPDRREARRFIAVDVGYTEPSEVGVWEHRRDRWWLIARVKLTNRMEHHHQADVISAVGQLYEVERIAVDATDGEGRAIAAQLEQEAHWRRGEGADFDRVVRVMFTESELVGWDADGEELWEPGREFATRALRALIASKTLALPPDEDIPAEFNQEKETRAQDGRVRVMTPRSVHVTDMCRVFSVLHHRAFPPAPPVEEETGVFCEPEWGDIDPAALRM